MGLQRYEDFLNLQIFMKKFYFFVEKYIKKCENRESGLFVCCFYFLFILTWSHACMAFKGGTEITLTGKTCHFCNLGNCY